MALITVRLMFLTPLFVSPSSAERLSGKACEKMSEQLQLLVEEQRIEMDKCDAMRSECEKYRKEYEEFKTDSKKKAPVAECRSQLRDLTAVLAMRLPKRNKTFEEYKKENKLRKDEEHSEGNKTPEEYKKECELLEAKYKEHKRYNKMMRAKTKKYRIKAEVERRKNLECERGWTRHDDRCYRVIEGFFSYEQGRERCLNDYSADVATPYDYDSNAAISQVCAPTYDETVQDGCWINIHLYGDKWYRSGMEIAFSSWDRISPDGCCNDNVTCVVINNVNNWSDESCNYGIFSVMCEKTAYSTSDNLF